MINQELHQPTQDSSQKGWFTLSRILVLLGAYFLVFLTVGSLLHTARSTLMQEVRRTARQLAALVSNQIQVDQLDSIYNQQDMERDEFQEVLLTFQHVKDTYKDVRYIYIVRPVPNVYSPTWQFVADAQPYDVDLNNDGQISTDEEGVVPGTPFKVPDQELFKEAFSKPVASSEFYSDKWGTFISGFAPLVHPRTGQTVAVLGVDVTKETIAQKNRLLDYCALGSLLVLLVMVTLTLVSLYSKDQTLEVVKMLSQRVQDQNYQLQDKNLQLAKTVKELSKREKLITDELSLAQQVQQRLLPHHYPFREHMRFGVHYMACSKIGGDLYDTFPLNSHMMGFWIADVSGHGASAALVAAALKVCIERYRHILFPAAQSNSMYHPRTSQSTRTVEIFMKKLNRDLGEITLTGHFVTFLLGVLNLETSELTLANAGHTPPIFWNQDARQANFLQLPSNIPLGLKLPWDYEINNMTLNPGDKLALYTDGLTERRNGTEEEFGNARLLGLMDRFGDQAPKNIVQKIIDATNDFAGDRKELHDDQALMVIEFLGLLSETIIQ